MAPLRMELQEARVNSKQGKAEEVKAPAMFLLPISSGTPFPSQIRIKNGI